MAVPVKLTFDAEVLQQLDDWQKAIQSDALSCIQKTLPSKVLDLNRRIYDFDSPKGVYALGRYFTADSLGADLTVHPVSNGACASLPASKKRKVAAEADAEEGGNDDGHIFTAKMKGCEAMNEIHENLRKEWHELIVNMDILKMWINLLFPKIEDGDTFGQSVQEEVLNEIVRSQDSGCNFLSTPYTYASTRAELCAKRIRYPGIEDYVTAIQEHDRKAFYRARTQCTDLRNIYAVVLDMLRKNIEKISKPKSGNQMGSYS